MSNENLAKEVKKITGESEELLAVIVGDAQFQTKTNEKTSDPDNNLNLRRYKIRIHHRHPENAEEHQLPWAYPRFVSGGLGGFSTFEDILSPNQVVWVREKINTTNGEGSGEYHITRLEPVKAVEVNAFSASIYEGQLTGFPTGSILPTTFQSGRMSGRAAFNSGLAEYSETNFFTTPSKWDDDIITASFALAKPNKNSPLQSINLELQNFINTVEDLQEDVDDIQDEVRKTSRSISRNASAMITLMRSNVMRKINILINSLIGNAPVASRFLADEARSEALKIISCLFWRLLANLEGLLGQALNEIINRILNVGECVVESIVSSFIGQILAQLVAAINMILGRISSLLGSVINFTESISEILQSLLSLLDCKEDAEELEVGEWNFLDGSRPDRITLDFNAVFQSATAIADNFNQVVDIPDDISQFNFTFNPQQWISNATSTCNVDAILCGPPIVTFYGGSGSGATGNVIVDTLGQVMGIDIITPGSYTSPPLAYIEDRCGSGSGANVDVGIGFTVFATGIGTTGVTQVVVNNGGSNYRNNYDGSQGGGGRTWAGRCQTTVKRANLRWDKPYDPTALITLRYFDTVWLPGQHPVTIDSDFTIDMLPGWYEHGTNPNLKSMVGFDDCRGTFSINPLNVRSMGGFDDTSGSSFHPEVTPPISPEHQAEVRRFRGQLEAQGRFEYYKQFDTNVTEFGVPNQFGFVNDYHYARQLGFNDKDIRFYLEGFYSKLLGKNIGPLMRAKLDDPSFGPIPSYITGRGGCGIFDCEFDYPYAQELGFSDQDIRFYLENQYPGIVSPCMQDKLDDPNWGRIPDYWVTGAAGPCPPSPPSPTYPLVPVLDDIHTIDCGEGYDCVNDTVQITPSGGAEAVLEHCDENGAVCRLRVTKGGVFDTLPEITINTQTGYGGVYKPIMKFLRPEEVAPGTQVIEVIDCVGDV